MVYINNSKLKYIFLTLNFYIMKKFFFLVAIFLIGGATSANNVENFGMPYGYNNSFIFTEGPVEFAVYPNGEFDFYYLGRPNGANFHIQTSNMNVSYNSGYNYDAWVQYDDYGAVIQIENVPIFYDYYGRIIRAGNVLIHYNHFGNVSRIGNLYVHYNRYNHFSHYSGYVNWYNRRYVYRPWHQYYMMPRPQFAIVYHAPYRTYYTPVRMDYQIYRDQPRKRINTNFYRPNENVVAYTRGSRNEVARDLRREVNDDNYTSPRTSVNNSQRNRTYTSEMRDDGQNRSNATSETPRSNTRNEAVPTRSNRNKPIVAPRSSNSELPSRANNRTEIGMERAKNQNTGNASNRRSRGSETANNVTSRTGR